MILTLWNWPEDKVFLEHFRVSTSGSIQLSSLDKGYSQNQQLPTSIFQNNSLSLPLDAKWKPDRPTHPAVRKDYEIYLFHIVMAVMKTLSSHLSDPLHQIMEEIIMG